jgi:periplasmic protein TonB
MLTNQNSLPLPDQKPTAGVLGDVAQGYKNILSNGEIANISSVGTLDDIVFENRNQEYGAYVLRKGYSDNLLKGVFITLVVLFTAVSFPRFEKFFNAEEKTAPVPRKLVYTDLSAPPPIDKPKPPPPQIQLPKLQKVIKFVPPKVVKEEVVEEVPTIQEIKQNETAAVSVEGTDEIVFEEPVPEVVVDNSDEIFTVVEQNPEFEGGYAAMVAFIKANMKYPATARRMDIEGTVHVSLLVSKTGDISDVKVLRGIHPDCDKEAVRVVSLMPKWKPGKQNGHAVYVRFILPLKFRMN